MSKLLTQIQFEEDITLFGESFNVYAIYSYNEKFHVEYISDYIDAEEPIFDKRFMTQKEFSKMKKEYQENIKSLKYTKHKLMTLDDLLALLKKQHSL